MPTFKAENRLPPLPTVATVAGGTSENHQLLDDLEERAALIEFGAGVPREWAEGFARLDRAAPPTGFSEERWRLAIDDGGHFLDRWAKEAVDLGWRAEDVFGVHPATPACRYDQMGLVMLICGGEVIALNKRSATIQSRGGSRLTYNKRSELAGICLWELAPGRFQIE